MEPLTFEGFGFPAKGWGQVTWPGNLRISAAAGRQQPRLPEPRAFGGLNPTTTAFEDRRP